MSGLYYPQQHLKSLIGSKNPISFEIVPATLTGDYSGNSKIITADYMSQLTLYVFYTPGASGDTNSISIKTEFSSDGVNWAQANAELPAPGTTTHYLQERFFDNNGASVALTSYALRIPIQMADKYFKLSVKETKAGGSDGAIYIEALLSGK